MAKEKNVISNKELAWYIAGGFVAFGGIGLLIVSIIESITGSSILRAADTKAAAALKWTTGNWGFFRLMGLILLAVGVIVFLAALAYYAKASERADVKTQRRASRQGAIVIEQPKAPENVVDVPVEEAPKAE